MATKRDAPDCSGALALLPHLHGTSVARRFGPRYDEDKKQTLIDLSERTPLDC